jgi:carbamoyl-phosphate synthase large subunit
MKEYTILMTSVGNDGFPSVLDALRRSKQFKFKAVGVDSRQSAPGLYLCDQGFVIEPRSHAKHFDALRKILKESNADFFLPLSTIDQFFYASQLDKISDVLPKERVIVSDAEALRVANNKYLLLEFLKNNGFETPTYHKVTSIDELKSRVADCGFPKSPFVLKTDEGTGAQGVKIVHADIPSKQRLFDRNNLNITFDELIYHLPRIKEWPSMHVVEYLPGDEFSVDVLCKEGVSYSIVVRKRFETLYGLALTAEVVKIPEIEELSEAIVRKLNLSYIINLQFKMNKDGKPRIIEINPRIPGTIGLSIAAGVNMPELAVRLALGEKLSGKIEPQNGLVSLRYWSLIGVPKDQLKTAPDN